MLVWFSSVKWIYQQGCFYLLHKGPTNHLPLKDSLGWMQLLLKCAFKILAAEKKLVQLTDNSLHFTPIDLLWNGNISFIHSTSVLYQEDGLASLWVTYEFASVKIQTWNLKNDQNRKIIVEFNFVQYIKRIFSKVLPMEKTPHIQILQSNLKNTRLNHT